MIMTIATWKTIIVASFTTEIYSCLNKAVRHIDGDRYKEIQLELGLGLKFTLGLELGVKDRRYV